MSKSAQDPATVAIGIDIGGTGIKGGIVDLTRGKLIGDRFRIDTPKPATPAAVAEVVAQIVEELSSREDAPAADTPVGVTFPAIIHHGVARSAANVDKSWIGTDVDSLLTERLGRPVHVMNDADAAGLAEVRYGAGKGVDGTVLVITLGTGIGSALIHNGVLVPERRTGPPGNRFGGCRDQGLGLGARTRRPVLGRVRGALAAVLLPRGVPALPQPVCDRRRHLQAGRRLPSEDFGQCPDGCRFLEEQRGNRRFGPAIGDFRAARQLTDPLRETGGVPGLCAPERHPFSLWSS